MNFWNQVSVVRLLFPFVLGILSAIFFSIQLPIYPHFFWQIPLLAIFIFLSESQNPSLHYRFKRWSGAFVFVLFYSSAIQLTNAQTGMYSGRHFSSALAPKNYFVATVVKEPKEKAKVITVLANVQSIRNGKGWKSSNGMVLLQVAKTNSSKQIRYGSRLLAYGALVPVPPPMNPGEFDYRAYLAFHNIHFQAYLDSTAFTHLSGTAANPLMKYCINLRKTLLAALKEGGIQGENFAVGAALILGYEERLDEDIRTAYASSGALHVLSVSGLHVAIVFVVLNTLLLFVEKWKYGKLLKALVLIFLLWMYAALTGFSPSVMRSAAMFTLVIVGQALSRFTNIYNTLAASMLILLIYNPYLITEVGFQLSYLAVLGIVSIHPLIERIWEPRNFLVQQTWTIVSVSLAAQLATFPLSAYYFHQFPSYFLPANLIVIPISTLVLYLGVAACISVHFAAITKFLCLLLNCLLSFLNGSVHFIETLPFAVIQGISYTGLQLFLLYLMLGFLLLFFHFRMAKILLPGLVCTLFLLINLSCERMEHLQQKQIIVYSLRGNTGISCMDGRKNYFFGTDECFANQNKLLRQIRQYWWNKGIQQSKLMPIQLTQSGYQSNHLRAKQNSLQFYQKHILLLNDANSEDGTYFPAKEPIDLLLIATDANDALMEEMTPLKIRQVVLHGSNNKRQNRKWKDFFEKRKIPVHDTSLDGAYVQEF